ncbi:MAG: hypothetical protein JXM68_09250 [Sedimentisphaerales bacterium]|nr:hypothetical protein [Sedimentisphaerales bacterium]
MNELSYCTFPLSLNSLHIKSVYEMQILALAGALPDGLRQSNEQLASLLHTNRKTIVMALSRLRTKNLLVNSGTKQRRVLNVTAKVIGLLTALPAATQAPKTTPPTGGQMPPDTGGETTPATGGETPPHNINNKRINEYKHTHSFFSEKSNNNSLAIPDFLIRYRQQMNQLNIQFQNQITGGVK